MVNGDTRVVGDDSHVGYQLSSPAVPIPANRDVTIRMRVRVARGHVCTGVLDAVQQKWILAPEAFKQEYRFNSGANERVTIVIANCNRRVTENERSVFTLSGGSYLVTAATHGADQEPRE